MEVSTQYVLVWVRLEQLPYKTEDLVQKMLKVVPAERISAEDALQHLYFSTLPPPIMHLRDSEKPVVYVLNTLISSSAV